ncbi:13981_t:CDS:2 [Funneliformis mosseae]|uniref:13981_t:CDS:1 n=1 Tax=Funneliformis mosseae TaxID=27381 RepID=A0A9N9D6U6_FUNMO|nr:13981_t:CDS:2 [Funneliformis mosseae]
MRKKSPEVNEEDSEKANEEVGEKVDEELFGYRRKPYENAFNVKVNKTEVDISLEEKNEKLNLINTKINVNIKDEFSNVKLPSFSKINKHFTFQSADKLIYIVIQYPVKMKEVHYTVMYDHYKLKILMSNGIEDKHIVINCKSGSEKNVQPFA